MRISLFTATAVLLGAMPAIAVAQDMPAPDDGPVASSPGRPTAPDGSPAFGIEPYVGVLGGYHSFDRDSEFGVSPTGDRMAGALISGVAGINIPLGPTFVGVEGNAAKGFSDIDWEYGVKGRFGVRAGESGMVFASAGYQWVNGDRGFPDRRDWIYGLGVEVGPRDIGLGGITGSSGVRLRLQMDTYDFDSLRPMAGVIFHF
jgi:outer membrane immunogenic protein